MASERLVPTDPDNSIELEEHIERYKFATRFVGKSTIGLDAACGTGYGTALLAKSGALKIYGVDIAKDAISYARDHCLSPGVEFMQADLLQLDRFTPGQFDLIVSFETIEHLSAENGTRLIDKLRGLLSKNGLLVLSCPNRDTYPEGYTENPYHVHEYSYSEIDQVLRKNFSKVETYCQQMRYFNRFDKKVVQFSRHIPAWIIQRVVSHVRERYRRDGDIAKVRRFLRFLLYEFDLPKARVYRFIERYEICKPVFFVFVCRN